MNLSDPITAVLAIVFVIWRYVKNRSFKWVIFNAWISYYLSELMGEVLRVWLVEMPSGKITGGIGDILFGIFVATAPSLLFGWVFGIPILFVIYIIQKIFDIRESRR